MLDSILSRHLTPATRLLSALPSLREPFLKAYPRLSSLALSPQGRTAIKVIQDLCSCYGVGEVAVAPSSPLDASPPTAVPTLKNLTPESLRSLCELSFEPTPRLELEEWCAALLRGSELNQGRLISRLRELWKVGAAEALRSTLLLATALENFGHARGDLRYLNAVLKIVDELPAMALHRERLETWDDLLLLRLLLRLRRQIESEVSG